MSETRSSISPDEILYIEVFCPECKHMMIFPLTPPSQSPDTPDWHKYLLQCLWCQRRFPWGTQTLVLTLLKDFGLLLNNREVRMNFGIKMLGEVTVLRQE